MVASLVDFLAGPTLNWMPIVTLLFLLAWHPWDIYSPIGSLADLSGRCATVLAMMALLVPSVASSPWLWLAIAIAHFCWVLAAYHTADNHQYLIGYWYVALGVALLAGGETGAAQLARNSSLLIGLCFATAAGAKLTRRRYRDGSMFAYLMLMDKRFMALATVLGGVTPEERQQHQAADGRVRAGDALHVSVPLGPRLHATAVVLTWWTLGIESLIAVLFLLPMPGLETLRVGAIAVFVLSTYLFVSVPGFGQILLIMLMATVPEAPLRALMLAAAIALTPVSFLPQFVMRLALGRHHLLLGRARGLPSMARLVQVPTAVRAPRTGMASKPR